MKTYSIYKFWSEVRKENRESVEEFKPIRKQNTALIVVDMQNSLNPREGGILSMLREAGFEDEYHYYTKRYDLIKKNIKNLIKVFRKRDYEIIYTAGESLTEDGRERCLSHKLLNLFTAPNSFWGKIIDELEPKPNEMIFKKTTASIFTSTSLNYTLRNMEIYNLIYTGVVTSGCVESSVRASADLGYFNYIVDDACGDFNERIHNNSIANMGAYYGAVIDTQYLLKKG